MDVSLLYIKKVLYCIFFMLIVIIMSESNECLCAIGVIVSFLVWIYWGYITYKSDKKFFGCVFIFYWAISLAVVSSVFFEMIPSYSPELNEVLYLTGATSRLIMYTIEMFFVAYITYASIAYYCRYTVCVKQFDFLNKICIFCYFILIISVLSYGYYKYGIPRAMDILRFEYWNTVVVDPIVLYVRTLFLSLEVLVCCLFFSEKKYTYAMFVILLIYIFLSGEKFTGIVALLIWFFSISCITEKCDITYKKIIKFFILLTVIMSICFYIVFIEYTAHNGIFSDLLLARFVEQGQIWWKIDNNMHRYIFDNHILEFMNEIGYFFQFDKLNLYQLDTVGIYKMMNIVSEPDIVKRYLFRNISFTEAYPAIGLYYFGYIGLFIFQGFIGGMLGIISILFVRSVLSASVVSIILFVKLYDKFYQAFVMGNLYMFFNIKTLLLFIFLSGWLYIISKYKFTIGKFKL